MNDDLATIKQRQERIRKPPVEAPPILPTHLPGPFRVYKAVADESGGTIQVMAVTAAGDVVGDAITLRVLS